jgi:hypothetical protein
MAATKPAAPLELWRIGIVALARWACGYGKGRGKLDPVYREVVEGRDRKPDWKFYSSCADLGHWLAKRCGVREAWVNRDDDNVHGPWERVKNVGKLAIASVAPQPGYLPEPGDIWILSNTWPAGSDSHVCVYLGPTPGKAGEHLTANYGASGLAAVEFPGAKLSSKALAGADAGALRYGSKKIAEVLTVANLVARASVPPDFSGPEWDAEFTGEVKDALEASFAPRDTDPAPMEVA